MGGGAHGACADDGRLSRTRVPAISVGMGPKVTGGNSLGYCLP